MQKDGYTISIEQVIEQLPDWREKTCSTTPLTGGLTNLNYKVEVEEQQYFVRLPGRQAELLAVDRDNEYHNSITAAKTGIAPKILYYLKESNVMVMEFISGKTLKNTDVNAPGMPTRIAETIRSLHSGDCFWSDFNMFRLIEYYLHVVSENEVIIPSNYMDYLPFLEEIENVIHKKKFPSVPCHNDLVAENFIDDGEKMHMVDFEYSGNNDPCFEMGDAATEMGLNEDQIVEMCEAYFGFADRSHIARIRVLGVVSDMGWVLWTAIQNKFSKIKFDFWKHMLFRWERAETLLEDRCFPQWLADCTCSD
jgi:thiamine kinase-like enzyme